MQKLGPKAELLGQGSDVEQGHASGSSSSLKLGDTSKKAAKSSSWGTAVSKVTSVQRLKNSKKKLKSLINIDAYALREKPATVFGLVVSILVWVGTLIYVGFLIYQVLHAPLVYKSDLLWTVGAGPFPALLTCTALDGCYVSNRVDRKWGTDVALQIHPSQTSCLQLPYQASATINVTYSMNPLDGLSVVWNASNTDSTLPSGFGAFITSETDCSGSSALTCMDDVMLMYSPVGPGFSLLTYVETFNHSASSAVARHRREWFIGKFSNESGVVPGSSPCSDLYPDQVAGLVQARVRFDTFYTVQTISKESVLLVVMGSVGGAYSLFLQVGALLLLCVSACAFASTQYHTAVVNRQVSRITPDAVAASFRQARSMSRADTAGADMPAGRDSLGAHSQRSSNLHVSVQVHDSGLEKIFADSAQQMHMQSKVQAGTPPRVSDAHLNASPAPGDMWGVRVSSHGALHGNQDTSSQQPPSRPTASGGSPRATVSEVVLSAPERQRRGSGEGAPPRSSSMRDKRALMPPVAILESE